VVYFELEMMRLVDIVDIVEFEVEVVDSDFVGIDSDFVDSDFVDSGFAFDWV
jgi:hypothetical protein